MDKSDMKWMIQMLLIIIVPIVIEYIKQKSSLSVKTTANSLDE